MADSGALRARRKRRHDRGDHSLCDPTRRCEAREQAETVAAVAEVAARPDGGYGPRGAAFRAEMAAHDPGPLHRPLVDEIARMLDRLDRLHAALERKGEWLRQEIDDGGTVIVQVDNVLGEARQQAATVKALMSELRAVLPKATGKPAPLEGKGGALGDLRLLAGGA